MSDSLSPFIVGFILLGATASLALVWAVKNTADGTEDETGFHPGHGETQ